MTKLTDKKFLKIVHKIVNNPKEKFLLIHVHKTGGVGFMKSQIDDGDIVNLCEQIKHYVLCNHNTKGKKV